MRVDHREWDEIRPVQMEIGIVENAKGSCIISCGKTKVLATASVTQSVPPFLVDTGKGWLTAEYSMLPGSTIQRKNRERNKSDSRSIEIQRLIGRTLRSVVDFEKMPGITIHIDCDVINADGGTRTASITGGFVALCLCVDRLMQEGLLKESPITGYLAAISGGIVKDELLLDLCYVEDSSAAADMNMVATQEGDIAEVGITGEKRTVKDTEFQQLMQLCKKGIGELIELQKQALGDANRVIIIRE